MFEDEEERKKREEEARVIISGSSIGQRINSINYANMNNTTINVQDENEQNFINKVNQANDIINSINPRQNVAAPSATDEELNQGHQNAQKILDLMDNNVEDNDVKQITLYHDGENNNSNANHRFRINGSKTKEEVDKEIKQASSQNVNSKPVKNNNITDKNVKIGLASQQDTSNAKILSATEQKAMQEANKKNENIQKGGKAKFEEVMDTILNNVTGGVKQTVSGLANLVTTAVGLGLRGLEGASKILGLEKTGDSINNVYNKVIESGSDLNEIANYERLVNSQVEDDFTKTAGDVTNVISNMLTSSAIGYAIPVGVSGTAIQGLSVAGNSAQEVLDENKDNIGRATLTGIAKGYTSYLTERMFDANILTKGMKKTSIQEGVDRLISNRISSKFGKEFANRTVGIVGENIEELAEDNAGYLIDKLINNKETPGFEEWWNNTTETAKTTTLSTMIMGLLGFGGESFHDKEVDIEADYWIDQAQQIIEQEDLAIHFNPSESKNITDIKDFYITRFTPEGEIANIVATKGKEINNPKKEINVKPAIVRDSITDMYTVIDSNTGVVLDSTPYTNTIEAENGFNEKINKLSDLQIRDINSKINEADYMITDEIVKNINQAKEQLSQIPQRNYNVNNNINQEETQQRQAERLDTLTKTINNISDKKLYNKSDVNTLFETVSNNINNINFVQDDEGSMLYSFDNDNNITYQQKLDGKIYTGKRIKSIFNEAINNADTSNIYANNNIDDSQTASQPNTSNFYNEQGNNYTNDTGYAVQDIKNVINPFDNQESYSRDELVDVWNNQVSNNNYDAYYDNNGNIERYIAIEEEGTNIVVNQYDNNDNVVKSEIVPSENGRYKASDITSTLNRVASLYDENRPIKGQQDIEGNEVKSMKKKNNNKNIMNNYDNKTASLIEKSKRDTIIENIRQLNNLIDEALNSQSNKALHLGRLNKNIIDELKTEIKNLPKDNKNFLKRDSYDLIINQSEIRHLTDKKNNLTKKDIKKFIKLLPDLIINNDFVSYTKNTNGEGLRFKKLMSDGTYVSFVIVSNKKGTMKVKTIYMEKGDYENKKRSISPPNDVKKTSNNTPETSRASASIINNSIPQKTKSVKNTAINKSMQNNPNNTSTAINSLNDIKIKYKNQTDQLNIFENKDNTISINNLVIKQNLRNKGIGQSILNDIIDYADKNNKTITLTPTSKYLTKNKLTTWYKNNGFVENKGKNTDFSISDTMYRLPKNNTQNNQNIKDNGVRAMKRNTSRSNTNAAQNITTVDNQGRIVTKQQQEYFKDSKVRDENGNLLTIYHTTTNVGEQFNIFDPRNTDFYRFGNQIVNYYTDSKAMSGSYADGSYEMAETSKTIDNTRKAKRQYEGYINITNPYIVDAEGNNWNQVKTDVSEYGKKLLNEIDVLEKNNIYDKLKQIYDNVEHTSREASDRFYKIQKKAGLEQYSILGEYARWGNIDNIYKNGLFNDQGKAAIANHINDTIDGKTLKEIGLDLFNNKYETLLNKEINKLKKQYPDIKDIPLEDFDIIAEHYDEGKSYIENRYRNQETTNDIVKKVIDLNNNGANYDGVIIKNIRDYGGGEVENYNPANVYVTFNSNQFKNVTNTSPTPNQDIRFAKKNAKTVKPEGEILEPGQTNAQRSSNYIEQEIQKIEATGNWDDSIPVTRMTDIRKTIENYLGLGIQKGHFRQQAYGIYKSNRDVIRTKELKDIDTILHETGHALDLGNRIKLDKESISNELLKAVENYGGYETETREIQLEEGFAEVIREYTIIPEQAKIDYPQTVSVIEGIRQENKNFDNFIREVQQQTYNYIHQNPENRVLSNQSIGERTNKNKWSKANIQQEVMRNIYDKDWALKSAVNEIQKVNGKATQDLRASENVYYLTRLASGIGDKVTSILAKGYIDENGNKLMPGLENLGEIFGNNEQRFNDLRAYLVAQRDLEYKAKTLKTGIRTMDSKAVVEQFKNDTQIQEASKLVYDTLDGVMQYAVNNGLITQETADSLRESNAFYVPMQRVLEGNKNNVGRKGAVANIIKERTGSELDVKDVLENIVSNSANIIQQVENNNILKALYNQGEQAGMTGKIYDVIDVPMVKIGTAKLSTWENELRKQGVDVSKIDLEKAIDLFATDNKVDANNLITSFVNSNGKRVYLQFNDEVLFNSLMNMDKKFMSAILNFNRKINMPLRYGATMANIGFAIPNMVSDTAQAAIFSEAGFIPVVDNIIGIMDIVSAQNKTAREFFNKVMPGYADRINTLYSIYEQTGSTSATRLSQYREQTQNIMKDVYGTKNSEVLGIKEKYKPLKRLLDIMTYIPEISEQSTRFRVFEKNIEYYRKNGMTETDARIKAALQSRDATQDFGRTGNVTREINQLIPFSAARVGSAYTFAEKVKSNPKRVASRMALLMALSTFIKAIGYDDDEIEELNQRKKNDNFVMKIGDEIVTIKKPQGVLRSIVNLGEYVQDLFTGHIEEGKEGERLAELIQSAVMDNMPADSVTGLVPNMVAPVVENAINKDLYYNSDIVKSYDLELPDNEQYYDYNSQLAIWLGQIFNYSPAKIDNLISGYFAGLGTSVTNIIDWISGKTGITAEQPEMGAEDNAVGKRFFVNVNSNSSSVDEVYTLKTELKKKENGGTITAEEQTQLDKIENATSEMAKLNKQIKEIKKDSTKSGKQKADEIKELQRQKTDTARQALGKDLLYTENETKIESTRFYPSRDTLSKNKRTLTMNEEMKKEYEQIANEYYNRYASQGLYSEEKLQQIEEKAKDYAKNEMMKKYKSELSK